MSEQKKHSSEESEDLRSDILRLAKRSEELRAVAQRNSKEAVEITRRIEEVTRRLADAEKRKLKRTSGRLG